MKPIDTKTSTSGLRIGCGIIVIGILLSTAGVLVQFYGRAVSGVSLGRLEKSNGSYYARPRGKAPESERWPIDTSSALLFEQCQHVGGILMATGIFLILPTMFYSIVTKMASNERAQWEKKLQEQKLQDNPPKQHPDNP